MNNNNLYNNNTFIGITHQDYFKTASNALATQIYITSNTLEGHLSNTSNILENHLYTTSNILENHLYTTSNILDSKASNFTTTTSNLILARYDPLIGEKTEHIIVDLKHTYIYNTNLLGEIRFWTKSTSSFFVAEPFGVPDYRVKIDIDGHLKVYYTYDPLINLTYGNGWVDVGNTLAAINASEANLGIAIGAIEIALGLKITQLEIQVNQILLGLQAAFPRSQAITSMTELIGTELAENSAATSSWTPFREALTQFFRTARTSYLQDALTVASVRIATNPVIIGFLGVGGIAFGCAVAAAQDLSFITTFNSLIESKIEERYTSNHITAGRRTQLLTSNFEYIIDNYISYCSNMSNMTAGQGFINTNITTQQYIPSIKTEAIYVNSGNINGIDINNLKTSGNIIENGLSLSSKYITSNQIYNLSNNYTAERQYPPKLYNNTQLEDTSLLKEILRFHSSLYLNNTSISYGSGYYDIFSSSTYDNFINSKDNLFNFNTADTTPRARFANSLYNSGTGSYVGNDTLDGSYYGDFVVIRLSVQISLTRYRIYNFTDTPTKGPSLWKVFGSNDGNTFTEITTASQTTRLTSYTNNYYEKVVSGTSSLYSYIAFVFSALLSTSGQTELSFAELQMFGKELLNQTVVSNIYTTSNIAKNLIIYDTPQVAKHFGFYITITTAININGTTYYKYDIDLRKYTQLGTI